MVAWRSCSCPGHDHLHYQAMPKAYTLPLPGEPINPEIFYLGALCKRGHDWRQGQTLRLKSNKNCILCSRIDALERQARRREADLQSFKAKAASYVRERRAIHGRESRSKHGFSHGFLEENGLNNNQATTVYRLLADGWTIHQIKERLTLDAAIRRCGRCPSIARLVMNEQRRRWRQHPEEYYLHKRDWSVYIYAWRYKCDPCFRRHQCQRNRAAQIKNKGNHTVRIGRNAIAERFADFDNLCAYCGNDKNLVIEHFIPRAKGGPHAIGNILPACHDCNTSKRDHDPETWYRSRPYFSEARWRKILKVLGKGRAGVGQLPLF